MTRAGWKFSFPTANGKWKMGGNTSWLMFSKEVVRFSFHFFCEPEHEFDFFFVINEQNLFSFSFLGKTCQI